MIAAVEPCSFVDFPGRLAAVAFTQGCDLRCRYCHNPELCARKTTNPEVMDEFLQLLSRRQGLLSGVVICGGEPTLWDGLPALLCRLRAKGFAIKLDTNGLHPKRTDALVEQGLIDYLAVDVKAAPGARCRWLCGHARQAEIAMRTLTAAVRGGVPCEARTVLVHGVHDVEGLSWLAGRIAQSGVSRWRLRDVQPRKVLDASVLLTPPAPAVTAHALAFADRWSLDVQWSRS